MVAHRQVVRMDQITAGGPRPLGTRVIVAILIATTAHAPAWTATPMNVALRRTLAASMDPVPIAHMGLLTKVRMVATKVDIARKEALHTKPEIVAPADHAPQVDLEVKVADQAKSIAPVQIVVPTKAHAITPQAGENNAAKKVAVAKPPPINHHGGVACAIGPCDSFFH